MKNLIICMGYDPNNDGSVPAILEERLNNCIELCKSNPGSILLLMGGHSFRIAERKGVPFQDTKMKDYIKKNAPEIQASTEIITETRGLSTVEELCLAKKFIKERGTPTKVFIVSSKLFVERTKLYVEYIFGSTADVSLIDSEIVDQDFVELKAIEEGKLKSSNEWLRGFEKGDDTAILKSEKEFERKILAKEISHSISFSPKLH